MFWAAETHAVAPRLLGESWKVIPSWVFAAPENEPLQHQSLSTVCFDQKLSQGQSPPAAKVITGVFVQETFSVAQTDNTIMINQMLGWLQRCRRTPTAADMALTWQVFRAPKRNTL